MNDTEQKSPNRPFIAGISHRIVHGWRRINTIRFGHRVGLVIAEHSIRLTLVRQRLHRCHVIDASSFPLDSQEMQTWSTRIEAAVKILTGYLREKGMQRIPVNIGIAGDGIAFRRLHLPSMPRKELSTAIIWEGEKLFPFRFEQCVIHHRLVERSRHRNADRVGINIVAAKKEIVEAIYSQFRSARIRIGQVNFLPSMMAHMLDWLTPGGYRRNSLLLFLDDDQSMALFLRRGRLEFYQQFVTAPLSKAGSARVSNVGAVAAEFLSFLDLYHGQGGEQELEEIILCGKYSEDPGLRDALLGGAGLPCRDPFDKMISPAELKDFEPGQGCQWFDAIAVGRAEPAVQSIIPDTIRTSVNRRSIMIRTAVGAAIALAVIGNLHLQTYVRKQDLEEGLRDKQAIAHAFEKSAGYQEYLNLITRIDRNRARQANAIDSHPSHFHLLLKELSRTIREEITLSGIYLSTEQQGYILRLEGNVRLSDFSPEIILAQYVEALDRSPFFDDISVTGYSKTIKNGQFDLSFHLQMGARV